MHYFARCAHGSLTLCAVALVACSSGSKATGPGTGGKTGSLTVTITAADGTKPSVVITGPNSYNNTISATQTLTGLPVGQYTIAAEAASGSDSVVGTVVDTGTVTGSPATVSSGATASATVTYAVSRRQGGLWIGNQNSPTIAEFSANQLRKSGTPVPAETLATRVSGAAGLALDANGNMWVSSIENFRGDSLLMYTPAERNAGTDSAPAKVLVSTAIMNAETITFDHHGNLWVANCGAQNLLEFSASQLASAGMQSPVTRIFTPFVNCPYALAFDTPGNMWVADGAGSNLFEYSASQLAVADSSSPPPVQTIANQGSSLLGPKGLVFDAHGNLWVSNDGVSTVVAYTPGQLAAGGAPVPNITVTLPMGAALRGMAFDNRGTLWVANDGAANLLGLTSNQIATTASVTPAITINIAINSVSPQQILFDPHATAVGVSADRVRPAPLATASVSRDNVGAVRPRGRQ